MLKAMVVILACMVVVLWCCLITGAKADEWMEDINWEDDNDI